MIALLDLGEIALKVFLILFFYLLGSLNLAYLAGKMIKGEDLRKTGTGSLGTSNVYLSVGRLPGTIVFFGDCAKEALAVLFTRFTGFSLGVQVTCALAVILGHNWPIFLRFRGGRGMAMTLTGTLILFPWGGLVMVGLLTLGAIAGHRTAEMSLVSVLLNPILAWRLGMPFPIVLYTLLLLFVIVTRRLQGSPEVSTVSPREIGWYVVLKHRLIHDGEMRA
jgi:glycerol-3-phosphate acyltransferase PlsY